MQVQNTDSFKRTKNIETGFYNPILSGNLESIDVNALTEITDPTKLEFKKTYLLYKTDTHQKAKGIYTGYATLAIYNDDEDFSDDIDEILTDYFIFKDKAADTYGDILIEANPYFTAFADTTTQIFDPQTEIIQKNNTNKTVDMVSDKYNVMDNADEIKTNINRVVNGGKKTRQRRKTNRKRRTNRRKHK